MKTARGVLPPRTIVSALSCVSTPGLAQPTPAEPGPRLAAHQISLRHGGSGFANARERYPALCGERALRATFLLRLRGGSSGQTRRRDGPPFDRPFAPPVRPFGLCHLGTGAPVDPRRATCIRSTPDFVLKRPHSVEKARPGVAAAPSPVICISGDASGRTIVQRAECRSPPSWTGRAHPPMRGET